MALTQAKLSKAEWEGIEIPCSVDEKRILKLLIDGFNNLNIRLCSLPSLVNYTQIGLTEGTHAFLFKTFLLPRAKNISLLAPLLKNTQRWNKKSLFLKKADVIRIENTARQIDKESTNVIEFVLLDALSSLSEESKETSTWYAALYAIHRIKSYNIRTLNTVLSDIIDELFETNCQTSMLTAYKSANSYILNNEYLNKVRIDCLYDHQKQLYSLVRRGAPSLIMYKAPTGTGKTLSPLGLLGKYRIVFICAARHVGLSLAKSAVTSKKKLAFAFNCESAGDIRLHYSAAKESIRDTRTGGIRKVDNTQGQNVELMISDLASAKYAIYYMKAFNESENLLVYWDEPTIALDVNSHPFHSSIQEIWRENTISNIVLSSATLPDQSEIPEMLSDYRERFDGSVHYIDGTDFERNVAILDTNCDYVVPHLMWSEYDQFKRSIAFMNNRKSMLRYVSLEDCIKIVTFLENHEIVQDHLMCKCVFETIGELDIRSIKSHYLDVLSKIDEESFELIMRHKSNLCRKHEKFSVHLTTSDAATLTNAPTIYLANDVDKVGRFLLQDSKIPSAALNDVYESITHNNKIMREITKLEKQQNDIEKVQSADSKKNNRNLDAENQNTRMIRQLRMHMKNAKLHDLFVPNTETHLQQWDGDRSKHTVNTPFTCNLSESDTAGVMSLKSTEDHWKLLLLMGIGVLNPAIDNEYMECMKRFAAEQKLYLILASSDYIYGTNYQFGHAFIGKDLTKLTQDKAVQSVGRVGRTATKKEYTVRLRNNGVANLLFTKVDGQPECVNMNRLFSRAV